MDRNWDVPVSSARSWFRKQSIDRSTKDHVVSPLHKTPSPTTPHFRDEHAGSPDGKILHWDDSNSSLG